MVLSSCITLMQAFSRMALHAPAAGGHWPFIMMCSPQHRCLHAAQNKKAPQKALFCDASHFPKMVSRAGIEPARRSHCHLKTACLPIPPPRHNKVCIYAAKRKGKGNLRLRPTFLKFPSSALHSLLKRALQRSLPQPLQRKDQGPAAFLRSAPCKAIVANPTYAL